MLSNHRSSLRTVCLGGHLLAKQLRRQQTGYCKGRKGLTLNIEDGTPCTRVHHFKDMWKRPWVWRLVRDRVDRKLMLPQFRGARIHVENASLCGIMRTNKQQFILKARLLVGPFCEFSRC